MAQQEIQEVQEIQERPKRATGEITVVQLWHVADVPGVQGAIRSLEVWMFGFSVRCFICRPLVGRSLFSVAVEGLALRACTLCSLFSGAH